MSSRLSVHFGLLASWIERVAGKPVTFLICLATVIVWAVTGPVFHYSETWQLVINTGTTIVTFLMVFLIQNSTNRSGVALQAKLDELIVASKAHNSFVGIEHLTDEELDELRCKVEERARQQGECGDS